MKTPVLLVDKKIMLKNLTAMQKKVDEKGGISLRPHIKTHKTPELAIRQNELGKSGITCAKLSEAEVMIAHGIRDVFLAYPLVDPEKIRQALGLAKRIDRFIFSIDTYDGAVRLSEGASESGVIAEARVEIDTGLFRSGLSMEEAVENMLLFHQLQGLKITGIYTYRGSKDRYGNVVKNAFEAGVEEAELMVELAEKLADKGLVIEDISVGSTPTLEGVLSDTRITEVRPGTYIFNDAMQVAYGVCSQDDCAAVVRVTVVSRHGDRAVIDGGSKSFATDVQPTRGEVSIIGFGIVKNHPTIVFERMNEEHGVLILNGEQVAVGEELEIIPNHICSTVNLYDHYYFRDGTEVSVSARGKIQ
ncbi:alanine racemase [Candidatus Enterococcus clewellii]|uniref:D-serine dehydratase-like domain-containing protein n=1 Tax=Candidatus Enterococcus clewellii TaxID=1834193 RepID=A0A242K474_9ENTE|nr:alanine racemase [Enterococcus sp. 9E7_DIV0242]OTP13600.1 hypothetical protein A5888_003078 [Enterococcus sp. 9E7_DIV0242]